MCRQMRSGVVQSIQKFGAWVSSKNHNHMLVERIGTATDSNVSIELLGEKQLSRCSDNVHDERRRDNERETWHATGVEMNIYLFLFFSMIVFAARLLIVTKSRIRHR